MKTFILAAGLLALTSTAMAADVGVSVTVGEPGFYGRIDIGNYPQPSVIYPQPIIIEQSARYVNRQPIYLRVPPGHAKKWAKHCAAYNACGQPVYFVQDRWYTTEYVPRYREQHGQGRGRDNDHDHDHGNDHDRDHGNGHGNGNGHGRGHNKD